MARKSKKDVRAESAKRIEIRNGSNIFADEAEARNGLRPESKRVLALGIVFVLVLFAAMILPTGLFGSSLVETTFSVVVERISYNFDGLVNLLTGNGAVFETRFMAVVVCAVSGAALGLCGSTYQGAFNNPLAAPKTLGVMSGGALGALVYVLWLSDLTPSMPGSGGTVTANQIAAWEASLDPFSWFYLYYGRALCSIAGCFIVVAIVMALTHVLSRGRTSNIIIIIFGQVFATCITAIIQFARYFYTVDGSTDMADALAEIENYTMIQTFEFQDLLIVVAPILVCIIIVLVMRNRLTMLSFGDDVATTMGINVKRTRYIMIALCTIMTGLAISFCGHIAFLGFISAHLTRRIVGPDFRFLLPASALVGATFITIVQYLCESGLPFTSQYAAGPVCSILGACLFIFIVLTQRKEGTGGWK